MGNRPLGDTRIAEDAGYSLSAEDLRKVNSNLNWAGFSYLDDAMKHAVILREVDGNLSLVLGDAP